MQIGQKDQRDQKNQKGFGFGIEAEFLLVENDSFKPLWFEQLKFDELLALVESIDVQPMSQAGFNQKPLHNSCGHYLIEGYTITDSDFVAQTILPKGVEIRTPLVQNPIAAVSDLKYLHEKLVGRLVQSGMNTAILSHHPTGENFTAPANYSRHDYWQWALTATATYGPDFNISLPSSLSGTIDLERLNQRVNFYMPSVIALSLASPLLAGDLWKIKGRIGKSVRTYRRSLWAPCFYVHEKPERRFEFKGFEMTRSLDDYNAYFLLSLALLLDDSLTGQASDQTRIYDLGQIAVAGLELDFVQERVCADLESAEKIATRFGFARNGLNDLWRRMYAKHVPADDIINVFTKTKSVPETLRSLHGFIPDKLLPVARTESVFANYLGQISQRSASFPAAILNR
ncbi:MAG: hypothetical protein P4L53_08260 [Candidatus Obscuribacterales bacterium]|nr:hypothetical protein [Candidatus Obscuribacterales bacterium]